MTTSNPAPAQLADPARRPHTIAAPTARRRPGDRLFTATTFLSALLLFSVQPMFAKMVLPVLGGSPSVWAVAMCFFQARAAGRLLLRAPADPLAAAP